MKGRKWLSVSSWGRQLQERQGAEARDILGMVARRGKARTDEQKRLNLCHQSGALLGRPWAFQHGAERSEGFAKDMAGGGAWPHNPRASAGSLSLV